MIGANPRREAPVLNARIRKRWRSGDLPIGVIGERVDLTYRLRLSRRRPGDACRACRRQASFAEMLQGAKKPLVIVGAGRAVTRRTARHPGARRAGSPAVGAVDGRLERLLGAAHRGLARRRRSISASCRARAA
ncbi:MAG: molybdopterin-dependent oxidoreductase [Piscinibacter sp.]